MYHADLLGLVAGKLAGVPSVIWGIHSANETLSGWRPLTRWVVRTCALLSRYPETILSVSESGKRAHAAMGYDTSRMVVVHNGYDLEVFKPAPEARAAVRRELGLSSDTLLVGLIARFHPAKDFRNFFKAASILLERHTGVHFLMAGTGVSTSNPELSRPIHELGLTGHLHLLGRRDDIPIVDASLDIGCISSATEAFPNSVAEAMACGVPCVVTDVGDAALIVGDTGRVVPPRNPEALARGLGDMMDLGPEGRKLLGERARQRVAEKFSLVKMIDAYEALYRQLSGNSA
jgi:glycosyltransferase involved in cell wall biosynthesis